MPLTPGLEPFTEDTPGRGTPLPQRPVLNYDGPDVPALRPVATPVDDYFRPAQPQQDNELMRLSNSLAAFNPALNRWGDAVAKEQHDDIPGKVAQTIAGKTGQDAVDALHANPELQNRLAGRVGAAMIGASQADADAEAMTQAYQTGGFDKAGGDLDKFAADYIDKSIKKYGNLDPNYAATYRERFMARVNVLRNNQQSFQAEQANTNQNDLIYGAINSQVNAGIDRSDDPKAIADGIRNTFLTNKTVLNKPVAEQEKLLVQLGQRLTQQINDDPARADQTRAVVHSLFETERIDPNTKQNFGALKDSTTLGGQVADVLRVADANYNKQDQNNHWKDITGLVTSAKNADPDFLKQLDDTIATKPKWFDQNERTKYVEMYQHAVATKQAAYAKQVALQDENAQTNATTSQALAMGMQGRLHEVSDTEIKDHLGQPKVIDRATQIAAATQTRFQQIEQQFPDKATQLSAKLKWLTDNPEAPADSIQQMLRAGPAGATTATAANGKIVSQNTSDGFAAYKQIYATAPALASKLLDQRSQEFYERARVAQDYQKLPEQDALALATRSMVNPNAHRDIIDMNPKEFNKKAQSALGSWLPWVSSPTGMTNASQVYSRLHDAAENLVAGNGVDWDTAIKQAAPLISKQFTNLNGVAVLTADKGVPQDFGRVATKYLQTWADAHKDELAQNGLSGKDLTMMNIGQGTPNWTIVDKHSLNSPAVGDPGISLDQLYGTVNNLNLQDKLRGQRKEAAAGVEKSLSVFDAANEMEPQVNRNTALIWNPYELKYQDHAKAMDSLAKLKANPDYARGSAETARRAADQAAKQQAHDAIIQRAQDSVPSTPANL